MKKSIDFLNKEELHLVTGGFALRSIFSNQNCSTMVGLVCSWSCKANACQTGCLNGCQSGCMVISTQNGYQKV